MAIIVIGGMIGLGKTSTAELTNPDDARSVVQQVKARLAK